MLRDYFVKVRSPVRERIPCRTRRAELAHRVPPEQRKRHTEDIRAKAGDSLAGNRESALFHDSEVVEESDETDAGGGGNNQAVENPDEVVVGVHFCEFARSDDSIDDGSPPTSGRVS